MRGNLSYGRRRDLLHKNHLPQFKAWVQSVGWSILDTPPQAIYEVLRIHHEGTRVTHIFFQRSHDSMKLYDKHNPGSTHITVPKGAVNLVKRFLIERG